MRNRKYAPFLLAIIGIGVIVLAGLIMLLFQSLAGLRQHPAPLAVSNSTPIPAPVASDTPRPTEEQYASSDGGMLKWSIGRSIEGREIEVYRWGSGNAGIALIGGLHGHYELNTVRLGEAIVEYFSSDLQRPLPANVSVYVIPILNPDGVAHQSRLNARGVDLNRNWDCKWSDKATYRGDPVSPGSRAFSEPETQALKDFVVSEHIEAIIFYHSAYGSVSVGVCSDRTQLAQALGGVVAAETGYRFFRDGAFFPITGDATGYFNEIGLAAIEIELTDHDNIEWQKNLNGILAALAWVSDSGH